MSKPSPLKHKGSHVPYSTEEAYHKAEGGEVVKEKQGFEFDFHNIIKGMINDPEKSDEDIATAVKVLKVKKEKLKSKEKPKGLVESDPVEQLGSVLPAAATDAEAKKALGRFDNYTYTPEITVEEQRQKIIKDKAEGKTIDHNKLYTNTNPLHNELRHDASLDEGQSIWNYEEDDAIGELSKLYPEFDFEET